MENKTLLVNERYRITITTKYQPRIDGYSIIYQPEYLKLNEFYAARFIEVAPKEEQVFSIAILDIMASSAKPCAVLEGDILTVILFDDILRINLCTKAVLQCAECENTGGLEQIHPIDAGYIIKGECNIFQYDKALKRIWSFSGRDIFATPAGEECFWIDSNEIHCRDWAGWHYVLDMNGNVISEISENSSGN